MEEVHILECMSEIIPNMCTRKCILFTISRKYEVQVHSAFIPLLNCSPARSSLGQLSTEIFPF